MNQNEAQRLVEAELARIQDSYSPIHCTVIKSETIEKEWGWMFFYQSTAYLESGDFSDRLAGNAPIIVNRYSGEITHTGTAYDTDYYIQEYEAGLGSAQTSPSIP